MDPPLFSDPILLRSSQTLPSRKQRRPYRVFQVSSIASPTTLSEPTHYPSNKKIKITISQPAFELFTQIFNLSTPPKPFQTLK